MGNLGEIVLPQQAGRFNCQSSTPDDCEASGTCLAARNNGNACPAARLTVEKSVSVIPVDDGEICPTVGQATLLCRQLGLQAASVFNSGGVQNGQTQCLYTPPCQNVCELSELTKGKDGAQ